MGEFQDSIQIFEERIRETPLLERLEIAQKMITEMVNQDRAPKTSIPVQSDDEDVFIVTTLTDAVEQIEKQKRRIAELALGVLPANLDVSKVVKYWHQRAEEAESKLQEKQVEQLRLQT